MNGDPRQGSSSVIVQAGGNDAMTSSKCSFTSDVGCNGHSTSSRVRGPPDNVAAADGGAAGPRRREVAFSGRRIDSIERSLQRTRCRSPAGAAAGAGAMSQAVPLLGPPDPSLYCLTLPLVAVLPVEVVLASDTQRRLSYCGHSVRPPRRCLPSPAHSLVASLAAERPCTQFTLLVAHCSPHCWKQVYALTVVIPSYHSVNTATLIPHPLCHACQPQAC